MANSDFWVKYSAAVYTKSLMDALVVAGTIDRASYGSDLKKYRSVDKLVMVTFGDDEVTLDGTLPVTVNIESVIRLLIWGGWSPTEDVILAQERLVATIRDYIVDNGVDTGGYLALDPPVQVEGLSMADEVFVAKNTVREMWGSIVDLEISNHS